MINTIFFGTHHFGAAMLQALIDDPNTSVDLVVTQPDRPVGRKKVLTPPAVKILAQEHNISVDQPKTLKGYILPDSIDIGVTAEYGVLIPESILNAPKHGVLNVHTSLLPKYRGASPIQSALINGDKQTGVTIMVMDKGLDTGPILAQAAVAIAPDDMYADVDAKLKAAGGPLLIKTLHQYVDGKLEPTAQDEKLVTTCKQFTREDGRVDWQRSAIEMYNQFRGLTPWPGLWTTWEDKRVKLLHIKPAERTGSPGIALVENGTLYIGCRTGSIEVRELQLEGKKPMSAAEFLSGYSRIDGSTLQ